MNFSVVGIDCATKDNKVGIARADCLHGRWRLAEAKSCSSAEPALGVVARWCCENELRLRLIALDAPLGWPSKMGRELANHRAGNPFTVVPDEFFQRHTDREIKTRLGKKPLEVGANLIARTAHFALAWLDELRELTGEDIPLTWDMGRPTALGAIEVYPAATRLSLFGTNPKAEIAAEERRIVLEHLSDWMDVSAVVERAEASPHVLDAILCAFTACEFTRKKCIAPNSDELRLALQEGWIWAGPKFHENT